MCIGSAQGVQPPAEVFLLPSRKSQYEKRTPCFNTLRVFLCRLSDTKRDGRLRFNPLAGVFLLRRIPLRCGLKRLFPTTLRGFFVAEWIGEASLSRGVQPPCGVFCCEHRQLTLLPVPFQPPAGFFCCRVLYRKGRNCKMFQPPCGVFLLPRAYRFWGQFSRFRRLIFPSPRLTMPGVKRKGPF